ncbi:hypothetical protein MMC25_006858 [Agyrium rufum]|nr:hypothetical protein [Agyrium rufum]
MSTKKHDKQSKAVVEERPLLVENEIEAPPISKPKANPTGYHIVPTLTLLYLLILIVDFGGVLQVAPATNIYERILCQKFYEGTIPLDESLTPQNTQSNPCKIAPIQQELALLNGIQSLIGFLPTLFLTIPYGVLVNVYGRRLIICLALLGLCLQFTWIVIVVWFSEIFPIRLIWLSSAFCIIGGGPSVGLSVVYVMAVEAVSEESRAKVFFRLDAARLIAVVTGTACSSLMMQKSPWLPLFVALGALYIGSSVALFLPDTVADKKFPTLDSIVDDGDEDDFVPGAIDGLGPNIETPSGGPIFKQTVLQVFRKDLRVSIHAMSQNGVALVILVMALLSTLAGRSSSLVLIYVAKRFKWSFAKANLLSSLRAIINLIMILGFVPIATHYLDSRPKIVVSTRDTYLARASCFLCMVGTFGIALASTTPLLILGVVISASGFAFDALIRSLLTSVITPRDLPIFFTIMSLVAHFGDSTSGPLYSGLFSVGLELHSKFWLGLPFLAAAGLYVVLNVVLWVVSRRFVKSGKERE